jgi:hypothetical protein
MTTDLSTAQTETTATQENWIARHPILTLCLIMFGVEFFDAALYILYERGMISFKVPDGLAFVLSLLHPAVAASVVAYAMNGRQGLRELFGRLLIWRVSGWWYVFIVGFYAADMLAGNALHVAFGGAKPDIPIAGDPLWAIPIKFGLFLLFGIITNTEELAWRGVALPHFKAKYNNALIAALLVSIPEVLLHSPDYFVTEMNFRKSAGVIGFTIFSMALSVIFTWVFQNTRGSLLIVTLLHASGNAWSNLLTDDSVGPFYFSVALIVLFAIAVVFINGPKNLSRQINDSTQT